MFEVKSQKFAPAASGGVFSRALVTGRARKIANLGKQEGENCHVGLGHGSGESDKLYSSPKVGVTDVTVDVALVNFRSRAYLPWAHMPVTHTGF